MPVRDPTAHNRLPDNLDGLLRAARQRPDGWLLEDEALELATILGIQVPFGLRVQGPRQAAALDLERFPGDTVVIKALAPGLLHKSDRGAVHRAPRRTEAVLGALDEIGSRFAPGELHGYLIQEYVPHQPELGRQLLLGLRWTNEFGAVVTLAPGGLDTELLSASLEGGHAAAVIPAGLIRRRAAAYLERKALAAWITQPRRGRPAALEHQRLLDLVQRCCRFAETALPELARLEINPLALTLDGPCALDAIAQLASAPPPAPQPARPLDKMVRLLEPRSIAVVGVSRRLNPGRIIVRNILRQGYDRRRVVIVKPGCRSLLGCRCVADLDDLPAPVDLLVVAIAAGAVPELMERVARGGHAESVILIPGGLGESAGSDKHQRRIRRALDASRQRPHRGPVVNGGNCLGIRSVPGGFDTLFIPEHKLAYPASPPAPLALVSQSGAFAVARASKLATLNPRYLVSIGNQIDLTAADFLEFLERDPEVAVAAFYLEGFRPLDGARWIQLAARMSGQGRDVLLYRAGRTPAGAASAAAHTEAVAGEYAVARELAVAAGVLVVEELEEFEDLVRLACALRARPLAGRRLGAVSNAGFECVAIADHLRGFELARYGEHTCRRLEELLARHALERVVEVRNPLDLTPIMDDAGYQAAARAILDDEGVDLAIVGCVPLTGALNTLAAAPAHSEDLAVHGSLANRLSRLWGETTKPWVAVVDGGGDYDPFAARLQAAGVPTFRSADRALRLLDRYRSWRRDASLRLSP